MKETISEIQNCFASKEPVGGLLELIKKLAGGACDYLEIGCREGRSLGMAVTVNPRIESVTIIDPWGTVAGGSGRGSHSHIDGLLAALGYQGKRTFYDEGSEAAVPKLLVQKARFDLISVDGDHSSRMATTDLFLCAYLLKPDGWIILDDLYHPSHPGMADIADAFTATLGGRANDIIKNPAPYGAIAWRIGPQSVPDATIT